MTYTLIAHTELTGTQATIVFSSIPATFTDLLLVTSLRDSTTGNPAGNFYRIAFNGGATQTSTRFLQNNLAGASSSGSIAGLAGISTQADTTSNTFANDSIYIPNYRVATAKTYSIDSVTENNATNAYQTLVAGHWNVTDAINSITLTPSSGSFVQFSSATLYGITSGSSGGVVVS